VKIQDFSQQTGMLVVFIEEFAGLGVEKVIELAREVAGDWEIDYPGGTTVVAWVARP